VKNLTKAQLIKKTELTDAIQKAQEVLEAKIATFNEIKATEWCEVEDALAKLNDEVEEFNDFRQEIVDEQNEYYEGKSERWQESDAGQDYDAWRQEWDNEISTANDIDEPDDATFDETPADDIENLREEP
jgi:hypothetical protein